MPRSHQWRNPLEKYLKKLSCYHYYVYTWLFLSKILIIMHILNLIFLSPPMKYHCEDKNVKLSLALNFCPCETPKWNRTVFSQTMQTKFSLYCDSSWYIQFTHSMSYAGALTGCLVFGFLSDKFGRINIYSFCCISLAMTGCLLTLMPSTQSFIFMRFLEGVSVGGCVVTSYVFCVEYIGVKHREIITALFHIPLNIGHIMLPGVAYLLRDMDKFQLAISTPLFIFGAMKYVIMESPKWLMDNGYTDKVAKGLVRITDNSVEEIASEIERYLLSQNLNKESKIKLLHIFQDKKLTINFFCMAAMYFVCGMGYYGVSQFIGSMGGNIYINVALSGLVLLPGTLMCIICLKAFSRKYFLMCSAFLSGIFIIAVACIPEKHTWYRVAFACISNCFFFMSFIIAFLYGVELFPTSIRNSVLGILSVLSRIGQILDPPINALSQTVAAVTFGVMALVGSLLCLFLPETKDIELPSSLEEAKMISKGKSSTQDGDINLLPTGIAIK